MIRFPERLGIIFIHHQIDDITMNNLNSFKRFNPNATIVTMSSGIAMEGGYSLEQFPSFKGIWDTHTATGDLKKRSTDLLLYIWYLHRKEHCDRWLIVEWDTFCNVQIESFYGQDWNHELVAPHVRWPLKTPDWYWWRLLGSLPEILHRFASGIVPASCILIKNSALCKIVDHVPWEHLGECNGELRFATLANACGIVPKQLTSGNKYIDWQPLPTNFEFAQGIYHPVKWLAKNC